MGEASNRCPSLDYAPLTPGEGAASASQEGRPLDWALASDLQRSATWPYSVRDAPNLARSRPMAVIREELWSAAGFLRSPDVTRANRRFRPGILVRGILACRVA